MLVVQTAWARLLCRAGRSAWRRRALAVVTALAAQRLVRGRGRRTAAAVAVVDGVFHVLVDLLEEEGALETHLLDAAVQARDAQTGAIVVLLNVVDAPADVDAFPVVGAFDRGWEVFLRKRSRCWGLVSGWLDCRRRAVSSKSTRSVHVRGCGMIARRVAAVFVCVYGGVGAL